MINIKNSKEIYKYSVLMPIYAKENPNYYNLALESIVNQTAKPDEIIIVEDGRLTEELDRITEKYMKEYKDIIKIIKLKHNKGLGIALKNGLLHCKNEIVFRMDSDDISKSDRMEKQLLVFNHDNRIDVVGTNTTEYDEKMERETGKRIVPEQDSDIKKTLKKRNPMNHMTVAYKKSKVLKAGNYKDMQYFEDYYLWARMANNNCIFYNIQEELVSVRGGNSMIKRRGGVKYIRPIINFENKLFEIKIINRMTLINNTCTRIIGALIPNYLRSIIYKTALRK